MSRADRFPHVEADLASSLGLPHDTLKAYRTAEFSRGTDWELVRNRIAYSDAACKKIRAAFGATIGAAPAPRPAAVDLAPNPPAAAPVLQDLTFLRAYTFNRRIVLAQHGDREVRVRVRDSKKFRAGMVMKCRHVTGDLWDLAQRLPRWPGKW